MPKCMITSNVFAYFLIERNIRSVCDLPFSKAGKQYLDRNSVVFDFINVTLSVLIERNVRSICDLPFSEA
jgi:hypothetical protein